MVLLRCRASDVVRFPSARSGDTFEDVNLVAVFWNFQTIVLTCVFYAITEGLRRLVQSLWRGWRRSKVYNDFALWAAPIGNGAAFGAIAKSFPWPPGVTDVWSRVTYCVAIGLFCGAIYSRIKKFVEVGAPPPAT